MKTIIFHLHCWIDVGKYRNLNGSLSYCNGSWKYTLISPVNSSRISVFRWDLGSTWMPSLVIRDIEKNSGAEVIFRAEYSSAEAAQFSTTI